MPRYELRNTSTNERLYIEGTLPIDIAALVKNGTYRVRAMSEERATDIVVDADAVIQTLSPADGALQVPINANLVMTFTGAMKRQGTVELRNVGGALIESFDLATDGTWSSGDTVWTGNPAADFAFGTNLCVRWSGLEDFKGNLLANNAGDTEWNFRSESIGLTLLSQEKSAETFSTPKNFSVTGTSGDRMVFVIACTSSAQSVTGIVVDPGGSDTAATIRTQNAGEGTNLIIADVVWPSTGALTVRITWTASAAANVLSVFNAKSLGFIDANSGLFSGVSPPDVTRTINTVLGQSVLMATVLQTLTDASPEDSLAEIVGTTQIMQGGTRGHFLGLNNGVAGATPEAFGMTWLDEVASRPGNAALAVYG